MKIEQMLGSDVTNMLMSEDLVGKLIDAEDSLMCFIRLFDTNASNYIDAIGVPIEWLSFQNERHLNISLRVDLNTALDMNKRLKNNKLNVFDVFLFLNDEQIDSANLGGTSVFSIETYDIDVKRKMCSVLFTIKET